MAAASSPSTAHLWLILPGHGRVQLYSPQLKKLRLPQCCSRLTQPHHLSIKLPSALPSLPVILPESPKLDAVLWWHPNEHTWGRTVGPLQATQHAAGFHACRSHIANTLDVVSIRTPSSRGVPCTWAWGVSGSGASTCVELQETLVGPFFQLISQMVPLASRLALQLSTTSPGLVSLANLLGMHCLFDQIADEDLQQYQSFSNS